MQLWQAGESGIFRAGKQAWDPEELVVRSQVWRQSWDRTPSSFLGGISIFFFSLNLRPSADWMRPTFSFFFFFFKLFIWLCQILVVALRFLSSYGRNSPTARGILVHWPRLEPASPKLEGRFVTTGPLVKSLPAHLMSQIQDAKWYTTKMSIPLTPDLTPPQALPQTKQWLPIVDFLVGIFYSPVSKGVQIILKWYANDNILLFF